MDLFVNTFHVVLCVVLILVILLQPSKGSDIGAAFGGGGSNTMFGPRGAGNMLSKATTVVAILFMVTSISLAVRSTPQFAAGTSLGDDILGGGLQELDFGDINEEPLSEFPELDQLLNNVDEPNDSTGEAPETTGEVAGDATEEETTEEEIEVSTDDVDAADIPTQE
jgi:preprotein translocase subunit SecG